MKYLKQDCRFWREEELGCGKDYRTTCNKCKRYQSKDPFKVPKDFFFQAPPKKIRKDEGIYENY